MIFERLLSNNTSCSCKGGDPLIMGYFGSFDNEFLNKYENNLKNRKKNL
jgi:hypothetical protein